MTNYGDSMKSTTVSVAEGKKGFSRLIQDALDKKVEVVVTRRGKPVAVIVPYEEYQSFKKVGGYRRILEAREAFLKAGVSATEVYEESRRELEGIK